jgi:hypothetical protein
MKNFHRCDSTKASLLSLLPRTSGNMITTNRVLGKRNSLIHTPLAVLALGLMPSGCKKSADQTAANNPPNPPTQTVPVDIRQPAPAGTPSLPAAPARIVTAGIVPESLPPPLQPSNLHGSGRTADHGPMTVSRKRRSAVDLQPEK